MNPWEQFKNQEQGGPWARFQAPAVPEEPAREAPPAMARVGRGALDVGQGLVQRIFQGLDALPTPQPSIQEIRAYASPEEQALPDEELLARYQATAEQGIAGPYRQEVNEEIARYEADRGPDAGIDLARIAGSAGATAPLGIVGGGRTLLARMKAGAIQGGAGGFLQYDETGTPGRVAQNVAISSGIGAIATPLVGFLGDKAGEVAQKVIGYFRGAKAVQNIDKLVKDIPELELLPPDVRRDLILEAQEQVAKTGELSAEQLARKANLLANEAQPTKSMVTREAADWTQERNLQKLSGSADENLRQFGEQLTDVYKANDAAFTRRLENFGGGGKKTQEGYGQSVMQSLEDLSNATQDEVGKIYKHVREAKGDDLAFDGRTLSDTLDGLRDNAYADKLVQSVTNKLKRFGMIGKEGELTSNTLTVSQAEELRKFVNTLPNDFGKKDIIRAIDSDVMAGAGEDAFKAARSAASSRFALLDNPSTQRALKAYGELSQGKTAQSFIKSQVIDGAEQDVTTLLKTLEQIPDEAARAEAVQNLRGGVLSYLRSKAVNPNSGQFSGAKLNTAIREVGEGKLIRILGVQEYKQLQSLARASLDASFEPAYSAVNHSNTAPTLAGWFRNKAAYGRATPLLGAAYDTARGVHQQNAYREQLASALRARIQGDMPQLPPRVVELARSLQTPVPYASPAVINELRQKPNAQQKNR